MIHPEAFTRIADKIHSKAFYISAHQIIFQALVALYSEGKPPDLIQCMDWLTRQGFLAQIGGKSKLAQLADRTVTTINIDYCANLVMQKYQARQLISAGNKVVELGYDEAKEIDDRLNAAEQIVFDVGDYQKNTGLTSAVEIAASVLEDAESNLNPSIPTSFYDLNSLLGGGLYPGSVYVIAAVPGGCKSALANVLAYDIAKRHKSATAIFSLEMPKKQVINRLIAAESSIPLTKLKNRDIKEHEWARYVAAVTTVGETNLHVDDTAGISIFEIMSRCRRLKAEYGDLGCVAIDYLQLMVGGGNEGTRNLELAGISRRLKIMARDLNVPVLLLSQVNRNLDSRSNKRPILGDLRDSGAIAADADLVMGLYRDELHNPDTAEKGIVELGVIKHRDGELGTIKLLYEGEFVRFKNLAR